jgi:hypothetical protein
MSNRATKRRLLREEESKEARYNLSQKDIDKIKKDATEDAVDIAMRLLLILPMEVLKDYYWTKTYLARLPLFTERVLDYYFKWQNGELDIEEMEKDLSEIAGVRFE